jgi:hypothetical protein
MRWKDYLEWWPSIGGTAAKVLQAGLSQRSPRFNHGKLHVRFMKMMWHLDTYFPEVLWVYLCLSSSHHRPTPVSTSRDMRALARQHVFISSVLTLGGFLSDRALAWLQSTVFLQRLCTDSEGGDHEFARRDEGKPQNTCQDRQYLSSDSKPIYPV